MESTYTFAEGDVVKWTNAYPAVEVWDEGTHLKFTTPLNLQLDIKDGATSGIHAATSNYDTPGRLTAQDVNITGQSTGSNYNINRIYISGIDTYAADIKMETSISILPLTANLKVLLMVFSWAVILKIRTASIC